MDSELVQMFLIAVFVAVVAAAPAEEYPIEYKEPIAIVKSTSQADPETGKYSYRSVLTSNN